MNPSPGTPSVIHEPSYEIGYKDGESNVEADLWLIVEGTDFDGDCTVRNIAAYVRTVSREHKTMREALDSIKKQKCHPSNIKHGQSKCLWKQDREGICICWKYWIDEALSSLSK